MLQITDFTEAHLATVTARSQKHGDDEVPAVSLGLEMTVANTLLDEIDPDIRHCLWKRHDGQEDLPGVESSTPVLKCNSIDSVKLNPKYEGWTVEFDDGIDETTPLTFGGSKVDKFVVEPKQGGSCILRMRIGTSDLDAERSGFLGMHVGQPIWIRLRAPLKTATAAAEGEEGDGGAAEPDATDLFLASAGDEGDEDRGEGQGGGNPFPITGDTPVGDDAPATREDVFGAPRNHTVVRMKGRRLGKGLGTDADQAARQAAVLAQDPTMQGGAAT